MRRRIYNSTLWRDVRLLVLRRDGYRCHWCGGPADQADHIVSPKQGGSAYSPSNVVAACQNCNARRGNRLKKALHRGEFFLGGPVGTREVEIPDTLGDAAVYGATGILGSIEKSRARRV
jgi:hypothetical protein